MEASDLELQPFFLVVDADTGEIYCAHQEYSASDRRILTRCTDEERILAIAAKANPSRCQAKERLRVIPVMCSPTINLARHLVDLATGQLVARKPSSKATTPEAIAIDFPTSKGKSRR